jgi:hypothetical protein
MDNISQNVNNGLGVKAFIGNPKEAMNKVIGGQKDIYSDLNLGDNSVIPEEISVENNIITPIMDKEPRDSSEAVTYFGAGGSEDGHIEFDLVSFRQKGEETRYLSIKVTGFDDEKDLPAPQSAAMSISNKEEFEKLKAFFSQLEWND